MYRQESELAEKRTAEERRRIREGARIELLNRLEKIKLQELGSKRPPDVLFTANVDGDRIRYAWDAGGQSGRSGPSEFGQVLRDAQRSEFVSRSPAEAAAKYRLARNLGGNEAQKASATLGLARTLNSVEFYRELMAGSSVDEYGMPYAFYAAGRLIGKDAADRKLVASMVRRESESHCCRPLMATLRLRDLIEQSGASELMQVTESRIHLLERAEALKREYLKIQPLISGSDAAWAAYGDGPWLVGQLSATRLIVVDAGKTIGAVSGHPRIDASGEAAGAGFVGLHLAFPTRQTGNTPATLERLFLIALGMIAVVAVAGAYLLLRDTRREVHLAQLRSQFVSSVSHELKTPLTAIRMFAENLQSRPEAASMQSEYLDIIVNESERLSRLVDNVLDFSKIEQGSKLYSMRPVSLTEVVRTAARSIEYPLAQKGFRLKVESEEVIEPVRADADALKQAILNLLINAMKYSGESREIGLCLKAADHQARIEVSDHGVGIPPAEQRRIFDRFYRVASPENKLISGAGLGLALVRHIAEAHGGTVDVQSAPGEGSAFTIRLPLENPS